MLSSEPYESLCYFPIDTSSVDGVLLRASKPIPGASKAIDYLQKHGIPFLFLTNGGGLHERERIGQIQERLGLEESLDRSQIVLSHTPFARLAEPSEQHPEGLKDKNILVTGGDGGRVREVAKAYGFKNVLLPGDIFNQDPSVWPFSRNFADYHTSYAETLPSPPEKTQISAIFVYNDPRDWGLDIQLILDLLLSRQGFIGTYSEKNNNRSLPNNGYLQDGQPPLYFSNADLLWAAGYHLNRLGQGGFREALDGVWNAVTGGPREGTILHKTVIGKPFEETYDFAEARLIDNLKGIYRPEDQLKRVYMVGDNPESDIRGANTFKSGRGIEWVSLLTRTGVWQDRPGTVPSWKPRAVVDDVLRAVGWALKDSGWKGSIE